MTDPPTETSQFHVDVDRVRQHYDRLSFLYKMFWGEHLHHGYWKGGESVVRAQIQLMEQLAQRAEIPRVARVLDIGCGVGGSALWLADEFDCQVTGVTISPVQARMAASKAQARGLSEKVSFELNDANRWEPETGKFRRGLDYGEQRALPGQEAFFLSAVPLP